MLHLRSPRDRDARDVRQRTLRAGNCAVAVWKSGTALGSVAGRTTKFVSVADAHGGRGLVYRALAVHLPHRDGATVSSFIAR